MHLISSTHVVSQASNDGNEEYCLERCGNVLSRNRSMRVSFSERGGAFWSDRSAVRERAVKISSPMTDFGKHHWFHLSKLYATQAASAAQASRNRPALLC